MNVIIFLIMIIANILILTILKIYCLNKLKSKALKYIFGLTAAYTILIFIQIFARENELIKKALQEVYIVLRGGKGVQAGFVFTLVPTVYSVFLLEFPLEDNTKAKWKDKLKLMASLFINGIGSFFGLLFLEYIWNGYSFKELFVLIKESFLAMEWWTLPVFFGMIIFLILIMRYDHLKQNKEKYKKLYKKEEKSKKWEIISVIFKFISLSLFFLILWYGYKNIEENSNLEKVDNYGERYGKSNFFKYKNKVYVLVAGNGYFLLKDADAESFRVLDSEMDNNSVGTDKNAVYFGNIRISDLNSQKTYSIGNNYYSDGTNNYYCSNITEVIKNNFFSELWDILNFRKIQTYIYPYKKIKSDKPLKKIEKLQFMATDGENVYYKGEVLINANLEKIRKIETDKRYFSEYFTDEKNVYYKSKLLPISYSLELLNFEVNSENYLLDKRTGNVFIEEDSLNLKYAPYEIIGEESNHIFNLFFVSKEGIFIYDSKQKKQKRIEDNHFTGKLEKIDFSVFTDDNNIYYLHNYEIWNKKRHRYGSLNSQNTEIYSLGSKHGWEKVANVKSKIGSIWKKEENYYYFDNSGFHQNVKNTIYEIKDTDVLKKLSTSEENIQILEWIKQGKLSPVKGEIIAKAKIKFHNSLLMQKVEGND